MLRLLRKIRLRRAAALLSNEARRTDRRLTRETTIAMRKYLGLPL